ncbi:L-idonate 5-dehydrogenase [Kribbella sp. NPDC050124]|uniref:L-idonate 5-dehydrogenase n=1 Tax=Kribbella sp. NPDC050124 TaxID=3364114 RepID=UPI003793292E
METTACVVHGKNDLRLETTTTAEPGAGQVAVDIAFGGICGSDLHYVLHGRVGDFWIREPMILGHEVVGRLTDGTAVAVHPATPCNSCRSCQTGRRNVCPNTRYLGSAAHQPHVQGGFATRIVVPADQVHALPPTLSLERAALAEPLSVALHAVRQAGDVSGRTVLVTGAGPIGLLVVAVLKAAGAERIIVTDLLPEPLELARRVGATEVELVPDAESSEVDIAIEASGAPAGLSTCVQRVVRGGTVVLLGLLPPGDIPIPGNIVVTRELNLRGAFRFDTEFADAIRVLDDGLEVDAVVTHVFPLSQAAEAFAVAADPARSAKVLLDLGRR